MWLLDVTLHRSEASGRYFETVRPTTSNSGSEHPIQKVEAITDLRVIDVVVHESAPPPLQNTRVDETDSVIPDPQIPEF